MTYLTRAPNEFVARVIVAKLGSAGILSEIHGLCPAYPNLAAPEVWVEAEEYADAHELVTTDIDDGFAVDLRDQLDASDRGPGGAAVGAPTARLLGRLVLAAVALLLLGSFAVALPHSTWVRPPRLAPTQPSHP
jgi:hypothetical protein